jgi:hypothetical protein
MLHKNDAQTFQYESHNNRKMISDHTQQRGGMRKIASANKQAARVLQTAAATFPNQEA